MGLLINEDQFKSLVKDLEKLGCSKESRSSGDTTFKEPSGELFVTATVYPLIGLTLAHRALIFKFLKANPDARIAYDIAIFPKTIDSLDEPLKLGIRAALARIGIKE